jgi:hypothetical protein
MKWRRASANIAMCLSAYVALHLGYTTVAGLAIGAILIGTSGPMLYSHYVHRQPLQMAGTHWLAIVCGPAIFTATALRA